MTAMHLGDDKGNMVSLALERVLESPNPNP